jgi:hypothetical protein
VGQVQRETRNHVCGIADPVLIHRTIGEALYDAARQWDDPAALISPHEAIPGPTANSANAVRTQSPASCARTISDIWVTASRRVFVLQLAVAKVGIMLNVT